jgi:putative DNA primase/helicase
MGKLKVVSGTATDRDPGAISIIGGELPDIVDRAEMALLQSGRDFYRYGGQLVRPVVDEMPAADMGYTCVHRLVPVTKPHLIEIFTDVTAFEKYDGRAKRWVKVNCPDSVAETYLAREGLWKVPALIGVINAPMLRPDGSLLDEPGYDKRTGLLYCLDGTTEFEDVPESPTKDEALQALQVLDDLIAEFPFATEVDKSVALSAILTCLDRRAVPTAPMHVFTAPVAGSGKTLLANICSTIATGGAAAVTDQGREDAEFEKRLVAALLRGSAVISIDNVERPLDSSLLCQALTTAGLMRIRPLGTSKDIDIPNTAMIFANGNNLTLTGDLTRRALVCRLDPQIERPELREFDADPMAMIAAGRGRYVIACLTILRAYFLVVEEERVIVPAIGSYEAWSRRVREALLWLGCADPCDSVAAIRTDDPVTSTLGALVVAWETAIGMEKRITTQALIEIADRADLLLGGGSAHPALREALIAIADGREINSRRIGKWLAKVCGRIVNGRKVVKAGDDCHAAQWQLKEA